MSVKHANNSQRKNKGLSQLTLVEHSLCPLDARASLKEHFSHQCEYRFIDPERGASTARAKVAAYEGLSPNDEFYLWGLLGLSFADDDASGELHVTPHFCLRQLGLIEGCSKGGKSYRLFREAIRRLSAVRYQNDRFWDPRRREHRQVSFGFFSYSLPVDPKSSRAWRIVWDPLFFEICHAAGSRLGFDLELYRSLDPASRRLFLLLKKVFWRRETSPWFDLSQLAVDVLGFSAQVGTKDLKIKVRRAAWHLVESGMVQAPTLQTPWFIKRAKGVYGVQFRRGAKMNSKQSLRPVVITDSPLFDPLQTIGFDERTIGRILSGYSPAVVRLWSDITLAAIEHKGERFFTASPQAYFWDGLRKAASGERTAPDWFYGIRKEEELREAKRQRQFHQPVVEKWRTTNQARPPSLSKAIDAADLVSVVNKILGSKDAAAKD